jgi:recombination protein RecT
MTQQNMPTRQDEQLASLKSTLASQYKKQIENYFGDEKKALKFLSSVVSSVQRTPKLLDCEPTSVINSFITMAELNLMPSDVSGEAYVLPYGNVAQFQLGYQGLVTLFYRAGAKSIVSEIVYKNDKFSVKNGDINHEPDVFADDRGEAIGAYVIVRTQSDGVISKVMKKKDIIGIGQKFSKSFKTSFSPWKEANDPELWMWKKTVLKQASKLVPKNETIYKAVAEDNKDSNIDDRMKKATKEAESLKMGNLIKDNHNTNENKENKAKDEIAESDKELGTE